MEPIRPMQPADKSNSSTLWTVVSIIVVVGIIVGIYFATRGATPKDVSLNNDTPSLNGNTPATGLPTSMTAVKATPKGFTVTNMGTFPYKVQAKVSLDLPNSCSLATGSVSQSGKIFTITIVASQAKDAVCAQVITPTTVTVDVPVAGLTAGTYTVNYGTFSKTFTLAQDNTVQYTSDK